MEFLDSLPSELSRSALRLQVEALKEKLLPVLGNADRAEAALSSGLAPGRCLAAVCGPKLVGAAAVQTVEGSFLNPTFKPMIDEYGLWGGCFRLWGLRLLRHRTKKDEWYVDGIAVKEELRGRGVGTGLLHALEKEARRRGINKLSLEVVDTNPRAKALYERLGFIETRRETIRPFNRIYGFPFESATLMLKSLAGPGGVSAS
jgi:ribosomal protein S18 acetylase RimI-like enzyme